MLPFLSIWPLILKQATHAYFITRTDSILLVELRRIIFDGIKQAWLANDRKLFSMSIWAFSLLEISKIDALSLLEGGKN